MSYSVLPAGEAFWRPSNQMGVLNTDLAKQLGAEGLGARFWRLRPGQASTKHRHRLTAELYVVLEGEGRIRIGEDLAGRCRGCRRCSWSPTASGRSSMTARPTRCGWSSGRRSEAANTLEMSEETLAFLYPDGPKALPPELAP